MVLQAIGIELYIISLLLNINLYKKFESVGWMTQYRHWKSCMRVSSYS